MKLITKTLMIYVAAISLALAQSADTDDVTASSMGSERAKLANERIQAEVEMRAREEQRRREEEEAQVRAQQAAARSEIAAAQFSEPGRTEPVTSAVPVQSSQAGATAPARTAVPVQSSPAGATGPARTAVPVQNSQAGATAPARSNDMSRMLEQLKLLGELKDDGYISEEEFQKIKQRILDDQI